MIYILYLLIIILFVFFMIKITLELKYDKEFVLNIKIYILKYIRIVNFNINSNEKNINNDKKTEKSYLKFIREIIFEIISEVLRNMKFRTKSIDIDIRFDTGDYVLNCFLINSVNAIVPIISNIYELKELKYNAIYSKENFFKIKCINTIKVTNIIYIILKLIYLKIKRRLYGKSTSDRKFNGNGNVFIRNNG